MLDLQPISPLWGTTPRVDKFNGLTITEVTNQALATLALRKGQEEGRKAAVAFLGIALPATGGHAEAEPYSASWFAPEQWLISADLSEHEMMPYQLADAVKGLASVTEQTDGWCRFDLDGTCYAVFERLVSVDLMNVTSGSAIRVLFEHLSCFIVCFEQGQRYAILGPRSSARSLHHALVTAAGACF